MQHNTSWIIEEKLPIADYIQKWGHSSSVALFDPSCNFFCLPSREGVIGYRSSGTCAVVFGDPVCPLEHREELVKAFHTYCAQQRKRIIYVATSEEFMQWTLNRNLCSSAIGIGHEVILDPACNPKIHRGADGSSLRNKWSYSIKRGITVEEYTAHNPVLEKEFEHIITTWVKNRKGPQIYFANWQALQDREYKRLFYATHQGRVVGLLSLTRLNTFQGFVINFLMLQTDAPSTTSEFLVLSTLDTLHTEGCRYLSAGVIPASTLGSIHGLGAFYTWMAHYAFKTSKKIFNLNRREQYWKKFAPRQMSSFILFSHPFIGIRDILGIMRALHVSI